MGGQASSPSATIPGPKPKEAVRFVCISDTHNQHEGVSVDELEGDVLLHAGDFSYYGNLDEITKFADWFASRNFQHKIVIAGNHDIGMDSCFYDQIGDRWRKDDNNPKDVKDLLITHPGITYLENQSVQVEGFNVFGSPMTPFIELPALARMCTAGPGRMSFNLMSELEAEQHWGCIPDDTDILLTHGPPHGFCDGFFKFGDKALRNRVLAVRPQFHVFGHIHEAAGVMHHKHSKDGKEEDGSISAQSTTFINAASCTLRYQPDNKPIVFDMARRSSGGASSS